MRYLLLFSVFLLNACAPGSSQYVIGKTTRSDVISKKGEPVSEEKIPTKEGSLLHYEGNEKFQFKGEYLNAIFRDPVESEKKVLYWQHQFKECQTIRKVLNEKRDNHTPAVIELACPEKGLSVIFTEGSSFIERVVQYAK